MLHETPPAVATALARWAPRRLGTVLEPAVGHGALLIPLLSRIQAQSAKVVCVDVDKLALEAVEMRFRLELRERLQVIHGDYLDSTQALQLEQQDGFNCIIMNPPFAVRPRRLLEIPLGGPTPRFRRRRVPIEIAFLFRAVEMLAPHGSLLCVIPSSIAAGATGYWLRQYLFQQGSVVHVEELPRNIFAHLETRAYLFAYRKSRKSNIISLCGHRQEQASKLRLSASSLGSELRLDHSYHESRRWTEKLIERSPSLGWTKLSEVACVTRGKLASPEAVKTAIHSTDFCDGFWRTTRFVKNASSDARSVLSGDLLITRVGRNAHASLGCIIGGELPEITDCVIQIRPFVAADREILLLALRCMLACDRGRSLVQRGSGAAYIVVQALRELRVPYNLRIGYPGLCLKYQRAVASMRYPEMLEIEGELRTNLEREASAALCIEKVANEFGFYESVRPMVHLPV